MGYDLVDLEYVRDQGGWVLRVFIDRVPGQAYPTGSAAFVTVDDCEAVTRQLQQVSVQVKTLTSWTGVMFIALSFSGSASER